MGAAQTGARHCRTPNQTRYAAAAHFTAANNSADADNNAPNPANDINNAAISPHITPKTKGAAARPPCCAAKADTNTTDGPGAATTKAEAKTNANQTPKSIMNDYNALRKKKARR